MRRCEICGIQEKHRENKMFFARFPLREHVCKQWLKVVGKEDLAYLPIPKLHQLRCVCENHFEKRDFAKSKTRLKKNAIPKLGLTMPPLSEEILEGFPIKMARSDQGSALIELPSVEYLHAQPSTSGAHCKADNTKELSPRKKRLVEDLRRTRCTLRSLRKSENLINNLESPILKEIVLNAAKNQKLTYPSIHLCKTVQTATIEL